MLKRVSITFWNTQARVSVVCDAPPEKACLRLGGSSSPISFRPLLILLRIKPLILPTIILNMDETAPATMLVMFDMFDKMLFAVSTAVDARDCILLIVASAL